MTAPEWENRRGERAVAGVFVVTGAQGFLGRVLSGMLRHQGHRVLGLDRLPGPHPDDRVGDLGEPESWRSAMEAPGIRGVFHLAGRVGEPRDGDQRRAMLRDTLEGTLGLLEWIGGLESRPRLVLASSAAVYGVPASGDGRVRETDPVAPRLLYGVAKAAQEEIVRREVRLGRLEAVIGRLFNVTGPGEGPGSVTGAAALQLAQGASVLRLGRTDTVRDFLDVRDAARALMLLMDRGPSGEVLHVASGVGESVGDRVRRLVRASGRRVAVETVPERVRPEDVPVAVADVSRLRALGFRAEVDPDRSAADLLASLEGKEVSWT